MKQFNQNHLLLIILGLLLLTPELFASTGLAFETGMDNFLNFFTGKFVFILSALAIIVSVGMFAFNHDAMGGVLKPIFPKYITRNQQKISKTPTI